MLKQHWCCLINLAWQISWTINNKGHLIVYATFWRVFEIEFRYFFLSQKCRFSTLSSCDILSCFRNRVSLFFFIYVVFHLIICRDMSFFVFPNFFFLRSSCKNYEWVKKIINKLSFQYNVVCNLIFFSLKFQNCRINCRQKHIISYCLRVKKSKDNQMWKKFQKIDLNIGRESNYFL